MNDSNFAFLSGVDEQFIRLSKLAEYYYAEDPNNSLIHLRQFGELLAQHTAAQMGLLTFPAETQFDLLRRLQDQGILPREIAFLFAEIHRVGNNATHSFVADYQIAQNTLKLAWQL